MQLKESKRAAAARRLCRLALADLAELIDVKVGKDDTVDMLYPNNSNRIPEELILFAVDHDATIKLWYVDKIHVAYMLVPNKKGGFK